jgi:hypothetical protein
VANFYAFSIGSVPLEHFGFLITREAFSFVYSMFSASQSFEQTNKFLRLNHFLTIKTYLTLHHYGSNNFFSYYFRPYCGGWYWD